MMTFEGRRVLITGGTGSLGRALVHRLLSGKNGTPARVIVMSRDEAKQHEMRLSYLPGSASTDEVVYHNFERLLTFRIGDVRSYADVCREIRDVDFVVNAAAMKQVPTCEYFPDQTLDTNCIGAINIARAISELRPPVSAVVGISTDKACEPVNVMGLTKALQERIFIAANLGGHATRFVMVRYGNIVASRGSVIPLFKEQLRRGGPLTVTHPDMTRFLLTLDRAIDTICVAAREGRRGEIYVATGAAVKIANVADAMAAGSCPVVVTGIRPGEKLHEVIISGEECRRVVQRGAFHVVQPMLPELRLDVAAGDKAGPEHAITSAHDTLSLTDTVALLERSGVMPARRVAMPA
jgi:FlaA1/EpsC-like NDP-sugar epimerase